MLYSPMVLSDSEMSDIEGLGTPEVRIYVVKLVAKVVILFITNCIIAGCVDTQRCCSFNSGRCVV